MSPVASFREKNSSSKAKRSILYSNYWSARPTKKYDWTPAYRWYLRDWLPQDLQASMLDLGCGDGHLLLALRTFGYSKLQAIDLRPQAVENCRLLGFDARCFDILEVDFDQPQKFQAIFLIDVLEHLEHEEAYVLLSGIRKMLAPGGSIIIQTPNLAARYGGLPFYGDLTHRTGFTPASLSQLLQATGFSKIELRSCGPGNWSLTSRVRSFLWLLLQTVQRIEHFIETGSAGPEVLTRVMLVRCSL